jgi:hypothetical protein
MTCDQERRWGMGGSPKKSAGNVPTPVAPLVTVTDRPGFAYTQSTLETLMGFVVRGNVNLLFRNGDTKGFVFRKRHGMRVAPQSRHRTVRC